MNIIDRIASLVVPHSCLSCGKESRLVCLSCLDLMIAFPKRCYLCHRPGISYDTCLACQSETSLKSVSPATVYGGIAKDLTWRLKSDGAQEAADIMAFKMASLVSFKSPDTIIVPVPTASSRMRRRGYDQARLLAKRTAKAAGLPWMDVLIRTGQTHQVGSDKAHRLQQLAGSYYVKSSTIIKNADIILIDDIATTGATLESAAKVLMEAGARSARAIVFARPLIKKPD